MSFLAQGLETDAAQIARFQALVSEWRREVAWTSSSSEMAMHPAYQQIIGMGRVAVPLLLRELEQHPDHWFWALRAITASWTLWQHGGGRQTFCSDAGRYRWILTRAVMA